MGKREREMWGMTGMFRSRHAAGVRMGFQAFLHRIGVPAVLALAMVVCSGSAALAADEPAAVTTAEPTMSADELALLLVPLTKGELLVEAAAWQEIVKAKAQQIARAEIAVLRQNREIRKAEEVATKSEAARTQLKEVAEKAELAGQTRDGEALQEVQQAAADVRDVIHEAGEAVDGTIEAARKAVDMQQQVDAGAGRSVDLVEKSAQRAKQALAHVEKTIDGAVIKASAASGSAATHPDATDTAPQATDSETATTLDGVSKAVVQVASLEQVSQALAAAKEIKKSEKVELLENLNALRGERTVLLDNMRTVVDELENKVHKDDADTLAKISDFRRYIRTVSGIHVDVTDTTSAWVSLKGWTTSPEGGMRWAINVASFFAILLSTWFVGKVLSGITNRATLRMAMPALLRDFIVRSVRWVVVAVGFIWALSALEISIAPLLALVGAAGFIIAFAMQDSLSNFANGLMILFFRPFDMGDVVDAGGVSGKVSSMNLVSTTIRTFDNKIMVVPNSKIWSDVITNATGVTERRIDMEFGIAYDADTKLAQEILEDIVSSHPKVLEKPEPLVRVFALADSSVNFICRPWARPADYWDVYWDVTRDVKFRFDEAGIGIPFPQRDVNLYVRNAPDPDRVAVEPPRSDKDHAQANNQSDDGGLDTAEAAAGG